MNENTIAIILCSLGVVVACGKDKMGGDAARTEKRALRCSLRATPPLMITDSIPAVAGGVKRLSI